MSSDLFAAFGEAPPPARPIRPLRDEGSSENPWIFDDAPSQASEGAGTRTSNPFPTDAQVEDDDDDFGDFEDASAATVTKVESSIQRQSVRPESVTIPAGLAPAKSVSTPFPPKAQKREEPVKKDPKVGRHPFADHMDFLFSGDDDEYDAGADDLEDLSKNPEAAMTYSKRMIAEQEAKARNAAVPPVKPTAPSPNPAPARNKLQKRSGYVPAKDPNVLFDAENVSDHASGDDGDDFGDFEDAPTIVSKPPPPPKAAPAKLQKKSGPPQATRTERAPSKPSMPALDLLGLDDTSAPMHFGSHMRHISQNSIMSPRSERAESILGHSKADSFSRPPTAGSLCTADDEAWDDFDASEPTPSAPVSHHSHSRTASSSILPPSQTPTTGRSRADTEDKLPPTNVPPPAILLSIFPSHFAAANDALFNQISKLDTASRQQLLAHPATHQFLRKYLVHGTVLAHIVAGRKYRWKRDQILAQSMRIGPAAAGGKGGMKLNSIDKSEQTKEDREITDIVSQWRAQAGKLRGAVTSASSTTSNGAPKLPAVPEIAETMPIKSLKAVEGGFTAPHACAVCGLKREERVAKVDVEVDDSFGEWWVNGMDMHVSCKEWWDENKKKLKSR